MKSPRTEQNVHGQWNNLVENGCRLDSLKRKEFKEDVRKYLGKREFHVWMQSDEDKLFVSWIQQKHPDEENTASDPKTK
jgi:hypothetical protein